jgi:amino acid adenylation domain-containing protein
MIYTSGSTGRPKGALNSHRGIVNRLQWMQSQYRLTGDDVVLQKTPFSFDVSVWEFFWPLMTGAKLVMAQPGGHRDVTYLTDVIERSGVTVCHFVPSMLRAFLADSGASRCTSLRDVMASGEALPPTLVAQFNAMLPAARLHNLYGPTECAVDVSHWSCPRAGAPSVVPIGFPVSNTRLYVLDAAGEPTPLGVPGELYIAGVQVGMGYHRRPQLTAERFVPDPFATGLASDVATAPASHVATARMYRTGDRARWLPDGTVEYLGRLDFQVKLRGVRIELGEIESALEAQEGVGAAVVVVRDDASGEQRLIAYVAPAPGATCPAQPELVAALRTRLPEAMIPGVIIALSELPLTPSGKVDRKALPAPPEGLERDDRPVVAPRDDVETVVEAVWRDVLRRERVGVETSFFDLGGHSLLATRITTQTGKIFRCAVPLRRFFESPTVAGLARALTQLETKPGQTTTIARLYLRAQRMSPEERETLRREKARADLTTTGTQ